MRVVIRFHWRVAARWLKVSRWSRPDGRVRPRRDRNPAAVLSRVTATTGAWCETTPKIRAAAATRIVKVSDSFYKLRPLGVTTT